jgi:hypothetical protein
MKTEYRLEEELKFISQKIIKFDELGKTQYGYDIPLIKEWLIGDLICGWLDDLIDEQKIRIIKK